MAIGRPAAEVVHRHVQQAALDAPAHHALAKTRFDHRRKDRDDVELHVPAAWPASSDALPLVSQQALGRVDSNPPPGNVHLNADIGSERHQHFPPPSFHAQHAGPGSALDPPDLANGLAGDRLDGASHELVHVIGARIKRQQRIFRNPEIEAREPLDVLNRSESLEPNHRATVLHSRRVDRQDLVDRDPIASRTSRPS